MWNHSLERLPLKAVLARPAIPLTLTDLSLHDPSTLIREGDVYWVFGTGPGVTACCSNDLLHWRRVGSVFRTAPAWIRDAVPPFRGKLFWAPDIIRLEDRYLLFYAASTFGSNISAIGLATTKSLAYGDWKDEGMVVQSRAADNFNAIDPAILRVPSGDLYLSFGSFWSGIQVIRLEKDTGKPAANAVPTPLAQNAQSRNDAIEAPCIYEHSGWFYLFVNWDLCCRGENSTYNIRIGRSRSVMGPYLDRDGVEMLRGGGTLLVGSATDKSVVGPGHAGILPDTGGYVFSCHYEYARANRGRSTLAVGRLDWDTEGWPTVVPLPA